MLSLILPAFNEAENLPGLIAEITAAIGALDHEIIVVDDDSPDRTWEVAERLSTSNPRARVLRRVERRGLSSAVVEGFAIAKGDVLAVMDSDGQHDPALLRRFVEEIERGAQVVVGSRYMPGGSVGKWVRDRRIISRIGTFFANAVSAVSVTDPLSGLFAVDVSLYRSIAPRLHPTGFKILLEILAHVPPTTRVEEMPLIFRMRMRGESKLSPRVQLQFFLQVLRLGLRRLLPALFLGVMGLGIFFAGIRAWQLRALGDSSMRQRVQRAIEEITVREGWLLSGITIRSIEGDTVRLQYREPMRGRDHVRSCTLILSSQQLLCSPS